MFRSQPSPHAAQSPCRRALWLATLLIASPALAQSQPKGKTPAPPPSSAVSAQTAFDKVLNEAFAADKPGAAVIVVKDGRVLYRKAKGMADMELGVPLQPDMVFRLGSITKQFTAVAILMLAEEGKLSLQDPIEKHLPGYPTHGHVITIEHLLTHTSGIQSYTAIPGWMTDKILVPLKVEELIDGFKKEPMNFAPGERFLYNNSGYILLGAIIEKASGKSYEEFIKDRIFTPLGMTSSYYGSTDPIISRRVPGYSMQGAEVQNARYLSMTQPYSAGSLSSTVDDLARWDEALYTDKLLKRASLEKAWTPYVLKNGKPTGYGYGWGVSKVRGRPSIEHSGGIFGFSTDGIRLSADHVYVAVLSNSDSPSTSPSFVAGKLAAIAIGDPYPERVAVRVDPAVLQRYVGVYKVDATTTRTVTVDAGRIYTQRSGGERVEIFPASQTEFFYDKSLTYLRFGVDPNGNVTEMRLHPDGADEPQRAERVSAAVPSVPQSVKVDPALYDAYAGEYELAPNFVLTVTREGDRLMTQATGQSKIEVFPSSETEFFLKVVDARLTFVKAADGKVDHLVLHQGGRDMTARKRN